MITFHINKKTFKILLLISCGQTTDLSIAFVFANTSVHPENQSVPNYISCSFTVTIVQERFYSLPQSKGTFPCFLIPCIHIAVL